MPKLIVQLKQNTIQELELTGDRVVIGRSEDSAVRLDDNLISREHAEIREENGRYLLSDLGSANGTYVGTRRVTRDHELRDGDVVRVSPYTISFRIAAHERPTQVGMVGSIQTGEKATEVFTFSGTPRLLVRSGAEVGKSYDLTTNPLVGRGEDSDIVLNEGSVSRKHARIQFIENRLTIVDVGSRSGTRVNGKLIDRPTPLKDGDRVQLGEASLEVEWKGGAPRVEAAERPTVPFFRPEPEPVPAAKTGEWWRWVVGIAAGLIVIVVAFLLIRGRTPTPSDAGRLLAEARSLLADGSQTSDLGKLGTALAKVDSVLDKGANQEAETLKQSIERKKGDVKDASDLLAKADTAYLKRDFERAKQYATVAREKDPNNAHARSILDAIDQKRPYTPPPPPPPPPIQQALQAFDRGSREEAKGIVESILKTSLDDPKAKELQARIEKWEYGLYLIERNEIEEAVKTFNELLATSPGNPAFNEIINRYRYDSDKARKLFDDAKPHWTAWIDYGPKEEFEKAKVLYKQIVDMHAPPATAVQVDKDNYNTAKERLESK